MAGFQPAVCAVEHAGCAHVHSAAHRLAAIVEVEHEEDEGSRHMAMPPSHCPGTTRDRTGAAPARGRSPVG
eukprot:scaffold125597_cov24-Phaeocystis_antarctica.AAC.1